MHGFEAEVQMRGGGGRDLLLQETKGACACVKEGCKGKEGRGPGNLRVEG